MNTDDSNPYKTPSSTVSEAVEEVVNAKRIPNKRVCAFLIDLSVLAVIESAVSLLAELLVIVVLAIFLFRDALFQGRGIGKQIVGTKTVDEFGNPCTVLKSFLRNIILIPLMLFPIALLIEYFVMRFSNKEQRLGDRIAKTVVIDLKPERSDGSFILYSIGVIIISALVMYILYS